MHRTMPTTAFHPGPGQRNGPSAVGNRHQQQLVPEADLAAIHNQTDFATGQTLNNRLCQRLIPVPHLDGRVVQQSSHPSRQTGQAGCSRDLFSHFRQVNRAALVQANHQPTQVPDPSYPFFGSKFSQHFVTGMVKFWYRHDSPRKLVFNNPSLLEGHAVSYSFVKTVR